MRWSTPTVTPPSRMATSSARACRAGATSTSCGGGYANETRLDAKGRLAPRRRSGARRPCDARCDGGRCDGGRCGGGRCRRPRCAGDPAPRRPCVAGLRRVAPSRTALDPQAAVRCRGGRALRRPTVHPGHRDAARGDVRAPVERPARGASVLAPPWQPERGRRSSHERDLDVRSRPSKRASWDGLGRRLRRQRRRPRRSGRRSASWGRRRRSHLSGESLGLDASSRSHG